MRRLKLQAARDVWGKHPDELEGIPYHPKMLLEHVALRLWEMEHEAGVVLR